MRYFWPFGVIEAGVTGRNSFFDERLTVRFYFLFFIFIMLGATKAE